MPTSMLELPRELFLLVCSLLSPTDLGRLAEVAKDYYLAAQESLYARIVITSWESLVRLVATLTKHPVVSNISARQRLRWQSLTDEQLRERDIKHMHLVLSTRNGTSKVTGAVLSRCIGAISRRSNNIRISLTLHGPWAKLLSQLHTTALPDVRKLTMFLGSFPDSRGTGLHIQPDLSVWNLCFSGSTFPDLREVEIDTQHPSPKEAPLTLKAASTLHCQAYHSGSDSVQPFMPFYGLKKMSTITLKYNSLLNTSTLKWLFGSNILPRNLTRLEISNCPSLNQIEDMESLSMLLQSALRLVQDLKLHLQRLPNRERDRVKYCSNVSKHPEWHICKIVREVGQGIKSLDLALPFACSRIFHPQAKRVLAAYRELDYPPVAYEPYEALVDRMLAAGYKHRRLICWHGVCRDTHGWEEMTALASEQVGMVSWEIVNASEKSASWHVSDCLPKTYKSRDVIKRELTESER